jgi:hypothetical protein
MRVALLVAVDLLDPPWVMVRCPLAIDAAVRHPPQRGARRRIDDRHEDVSGCEHRGGEGERAMQVAQRAAHQQQCESGQVQPGQPDDDQPRIQLLAAVEATHGRRRPAGSRSTPARSAGDRPTRAGYA